MPAHSAGGGGGSTVHRAGWLLLVCVILGLLHAASQRTTDTTNNIVVHPCHCHRTSPRQTCSWSSRGKVPKDHLATWRCLSQTTLTEDFLVLLLCVPWCSHCVRTLYGGHLGALTILPALSSSLTSPLLPDSAPTPSYSSLDHSGISVPYPGASLLW